MNYLRITPEFRNHFPPELIEYDGVFQVKEIIHIGVYCYPVEEPERIHRFELKHCIEVNDNEGFHAVVTKIAANL